MPIVEELTAPLAPIIYVTAPLTPMVEDLTQPLAPVVEDLTPLTPSSMKSLRRSPRSSTMRPHRSLRWWRTLTAPLAPVILEESNGAARLRSSTMRPHRSLRWWRT